MPLTEKQERQKQHIRDTYGSKEKGDRVFYAMERMGKITGRHKRKSKRKHKRKGRR